MRTSDHLDSSAREGWDWKEIFGGCHCLGCHWQLAPSKDSSKSNFVEDGLSSFEPAETDPIQIVFCFFSIGREGVYTKYHWQDVVTGHKKTTFLFISVKQGISSFGQEESNKINQIDFFASLPFHWSAWTQAMAANSILINLPEIEFSFSLSFCLLLFDPSVHPGLKNTYISTKINYITTKQKQNTVTLQHWLIT